MVVYMGLSWFEGLCKGLIYYNVLIIWLVVVIENVILFE